ncbi:hypothetical protein QBC43DRAFT_127256 [Cladorrhinum sp. PSN259]|nr:hypothetical protein QBC43DRAFT_127256 [Cladorrhinum sp. PSN259]
MGSSTLSLKRALLLSVFFAANALAQNDNTRPAATTNAPAPPPTTTQNNPPPRTTSTQAPPPAQTKEEDKKESSEIPTPSGPLPPLGQGTTTITTNDPSQPSEFVTQSNLPKLSKTVDNFIPEYPPPTIPPTRDAPFMNNSTLPDGTVFIAVGAILGAFGLAILAWRAIVVCLLHRSVERAALAQHTATDKSAASFPAPPAQFYNYLDRNSSASLALGGGGAGAAGVGVRRSHRGPTPSATPSQTNLFFSPTAAGSNQGLGASNRDSRFLPSGFYAAASPNPGGHAHGNSISMNNLRPSSRGRAGHMGPSPPDSPGFGPTNGSPAMGVGMSRGNFSSSSLNLPRPASAGQGANGGRAPSAYLDDLLDDQPGLFPPAGMSPTGHQGQGGQQGQYNGGRTSPGSPLGRRH